MFTNLGRHSALALAAGLALAACSSRNDTATRNDTAAGAIAADSTANAKHNGWTDAQILAFTSAANIGEIQESKLATTKATNSAVKAYARQLQTDHQNMLDEGSKFASSNNIVPDTTKDDVKDAIKDAGDEYKELADAKAGKEWDEKYIDEQIDGHKKVLEKLQDLEKSTSNAQLRDMLTKAAGKVQEHLTKAEGIKANNLKS